MTQKKKPVLRFKGFTDDWEQRKIFELFKITRGHVLASPLISDTKTGDKPYPVFSSQTKNNGLMGYYKDYLYQDAITWTTDGANAGTVNYRAEKFYCTNVCGVLLADKVIPNQMIAEALNKVAKRHVSYVGNPKLMNNVMADIEITLPDDENEQKRISYLFDKIDNLITLHQRKYEKLRNLKKFFLEKIFPQNGKRVPEVRFAGFTGNWEQRKLGELAEFNPKASLPDSFEYVDLESVVGTRIINHRTEKKDSAPSRAQRLAQPGDVFYQTVRPYQRNNCLFTGAEKSYVFSTGYAQLRSHGDSYFLLTMLQKDDFVNSVMDRCTGTSYPAINSNELAEINVIFPTIIQEQKELGQFFKNIDNLITLHQRKLEKLQNLKKAALDKMFV